MKNNNGAAVALATPAIPSELLAITDKEQLSNAIAQDIITRFAPFQAQIDEWREKAEQLQVTSEDQVAEMKQAREARLALVKVRTGADKVRKELKEESTRYNRAVQNIYNLIEEGIKPIESHLEKQEKYKEIQEAKRRDELRIQRQEQINGLHEYFPLNIDLGYMTQEDFDRMYNGALLQQRAAKEAKQKAEQARLEQQQRDEEEREALRKENEKLKAIMEERNKIVAERFSEIQAYISYGEPVEVQTLWELTPEAFAGLLERKRTAWEEQRQRNIQAAKEQAEKDAAAKADAEKQAALEAEAAKGDREKFKDLLSRLESIKTEFAFKSKKYKTLHVGVCDLIDKTTAWANTKL